MFQSFDTTSNPAQGPARLKALRTAMNEASVDGFLVPRADAHQGEYVAPHDDRLIWLTGFSGSAGFCCALKETAGLFVDGRYRIQAKQQVADDFTIVHWPEVSLAAWLKETGIKGTIGFDPWLHTAREIERLEIELANSGISLQPIHNLVDAIWADQPAPPTAKVLPYPEELAGEHHADKMVRLAADLRGKGQSAAVTTLPDSLCWLLNIRGSDISRNPIAQGFAILHDDARVDLFMAPEKLADAYDHLGDKVTCHGPNELMPMLAALSGVVRLDKGSVPLAIASVLAASGLEIAYDQDPCALPKACKNAQEIAGTTEAHLRDGAAVCNFLAWFDENAEQHITEIDVATQLENCRRDTGLLRDISFDTIAGAGPNGAVIHYRVTHDTNRTLQSGEIMVVDSGGQYLDGTTDITRTLPIGNIGKKESHAFTLVLKGMIAVSQLRWPAGLAGRDLEAMGRVPLWQAGMDFDHGLGHGVGTYLCVHEGPQRLSKISDVPLMPGMILSNEPGYYREGAFGIRIENLVVVEHAPSLEGGDSHRDMLQFRTLTYAPIDRRLIVTDLLTADERDWLNTYHQECFDHLSPRVGSETRRWLSEVTKPL
ncbi:MAG: aminopeptidase P family protein [Cognatishimia sp.]